MLAQVLDQLDGIHFGDDDDSSGKSGALLEAVSNFYDGDYYGDSYDQSGIPYRRDEKHWVDFFSNLAGKVVETLEPHTALDVGCAIGLFVEALRNQGVDAAGDRRLEVGDRPGSSGASPLLQGGVDHR